MRRSDGDTNRSLRVFTSGLTVKPTVLSDACNGDNEVDGKPGGTLSATFADDCSIEDTYLSGYVIFSGSCVPTSIDVEGGIGILGAIGLIGVTQEGVSEITTSLRITEFSSTSMVGSYTLTRTTASVLDCYDHGIFSLRKTGGSDDSRGLTGKWKGKWISKQ